MVSTSKVKSRRGKRCNRNEIKTTEARRRANGIFGTDRCPELILSQIDILINCPFTNPGLSFLGDLQSK